MGLLQVGQDFQKDGSGRAQIPQSGSVVVLAGVALTLPQATHRAGRFWHGMHTVGR